jgi:hypothetical protein
VLDDRAQTPRAAVVPIVASPKPLSAAVAVWHDGLLIPQEGGPISFVSLVGDDTAAAPFPFQPAQRPGAVARWLRPAVIDQLQFLAADRNGEVFVVTTREAGARHYAASDSLHLAKPIVGGPVLLGDTPLVVERGDATDALTALTISPLQTGDTLPLPGRLVWGPHVVGAMALLATDPGGLFAVGDPAAIQWSLNLNGEQPVGLPLAIDDAIWLATTSGNLRCIEISSGEVRHNIALGQPLGSGPTRFGNAIALRAADGTVLIVEPQP